MMVYQLIRLMNLTAEICAAKTTIHPDYGNLASTNNY